MEKRSKVPKTYLGFLKISHVDLKMAYLPHKQKIFWPENGEILKFGIFYENSRSFRTFEACILKISKGRKSDGHFVHPTRLNRVNNRHVNCSRTYGILMQLEFVRM